MKQILLFISPDRQPAWVMALKTDPFKPYVLQAIHHYIDKFSDLTPAFDGFLFLDAALLRAQETEALRLRLSEGHAFKIILLLERLAELLAYRDLLTFFNAVSAIEMDIAEVYRILKTLSAREFTDGVWLSNTLHAQEDETVSKVLADLTAREREVFSLAMRALPNKDIADMLNLSVRTIESHLDSIKGKLQVKTKIELIGRFSDAGKSSDEADLSDVQPEERPD